MCILTGMCGIYGGTWLTGILYLVLFAVLVVAGVVFVARHLGRPRTGDRDE